MFFNIRWRWFTKLFLFFLFFFLFSNRSLKVSPTNPCFYDNRSISFDIILLLFSSFLVRKPKTNITYRNNRYWRLIYRQKSSVYFFFKEVGTVSFPLSVFCVFFSFFQTLFFPLFLGTKRRKVLSTMMGKKSRLEIVFFALLCSVNYVSSQIQQLPPSHHSSQSSLSSSPMNNPLLPSNLYNQDSNDINRDLILPEP